MWNANKQFTDTSQAHGANSRSFGRIFNAGALGLYGMTVPEVTAILMMVGRARGNRCGRTNRSHPPR
jgi:hypothetical protein